MPANMGKGGEKKGGVLHNPIEKVLELYLLQCGRSRLTKAGIADAMEKAIKLSGATCEKKITCAFRSDSEVLGVSDVRILSESHSAAHSYPEHNYISIVIATCGDKTHPFRAVGHLLSAFNPDVGNISYTKVGMDLTNSSGFPKHAKTLVKKYLKQFNLEKYNFKICELESGDYSIYFWNKEGIDESTVTKHFKMTKKQFWRYTRI